MSENSDKTLHLDEAAAIGDIIRMAESNAKVAKVVDYGEGVVYGTARSIGDENGCWCAKVHNVDVRDQFLRVTTKGGFEAFWKVSELIPLIQTTEFVTYDW